MEVRSRLTRSSREETTSRTMNKNLKEALKKMELLFSHSVIYLYGYITESYVVGDDERFYRISACNQVLELPKKELVFPEDCLCIHLWGDSTASPVKTTNSKYNCAFFLTAYATTLTILGFEVYVNDQPFNPEESINWRKL